MEELYSIAICPPDYVSQQVRTMKKLLATKIKWYNSVNSDAHITFNNFHANNNKIFLIEKMLCHFTTTLIPFTLSFDNFGFFANGAFFLSPDKTSQQTLINVMKKCHSQMPFPMKYKSINPHMSIARKLNSNQLALAGELFSPMKISINFLCERITLRKFNEQIKQYEAYKHFPFNNIKQ